MEMALAPLCGANAVITPMESNANTEIPRNYYQNNWIGRSYSKSRFFRKCINRHSPVLGNWYYEHMPAFRVRELVSEKIWSDYYKFCFERNPWEKVVSYYNWKKFGQKRKMPDFKSYVMNKSHRLPRDANLYFDGEICMMDRVGDFSDLNNHFAEICRDLAIPFDGELPREKTNITSEKVDYRDYYDTETRDKVYELFQREIKLKKFNF